MRHHAGADAGVLQDVECRLADVRVHVLGERVGEEHRPWRRGRRPRRRPSRQRAAGPHRRHPAAVDARGPFAQRAAQRAARHQVGQRRQPAAPAGQSTHMAEGLHLERRAVPGPVPGQHLALDAGHVHAHRALALARPALETEVERLVQAGVVEAVGPSWPVIARRSTLARPRVECASSRVAMYDGHIVPSRVLRQAPTPLHASTARPKPPLREVEVAGRLRRAIGRAVAQVRGDRRRVDDPAGIEAGRRDRRCASRCGTPGRAWCRTSAR